jgi:hypothetical protein
MESIELEVGASIYDITFNNLFVITQVNSDEIECKCYDGYQTTDQYFFEKARIPLEGVYRYLNTNVWAYIQPTFNQDELEKKILLIKLKHA